MLMKVLLSIHFSSSNSSYRSAKERGSHDAWSWAAYFHQGSLCDAETGFLRPETARDTSGQWNIIVQSDDMKQRVPIEMCRYVFAVITFRKSRCLMLINYYVGRTKLKQLDIYM